MKKIITLSGHSERFLNEGFTIKPLIKIHGKYIIEYVVDSIKEDDEDDFSDYIFIIKDEDDIHYNIVKILSELFPNGVIKSIPSHKDGPVVSIMKIIDECGINEDEEILISYCDLYINWNIITFINFVRSNNDDGSIVSHTGFHPHRINNKYFAYMRTDNDQVLEIKEKQAFTDNPDDEYASGGIYYFKTLKYLKYYMNKLLSDKIRVNNEFYVTMIYNHMIKEDKQISHFDSKNYVCLGTPMDVTIFDSSINLLKNINSIEDIMKSLEYFKKHYF